MRAHWVLVIAGLAFAAGYWVGGSVALIGLAGVVSGAGTLRRDAHSRRRAGPPPVAWRDVGALVLLVLLITTSRALHAQAPPDSGTVLAAQRIPMRTIPDTRGIRFGHFDARVLRTFQQLEELADSSGVEEALCLHGWLLWPHSFVVEYTITPLQITNRSATGARVDCHRSLGYLGVAHTHPEALHEHALIGDRFELGVRNDGLVTVAVADGQLMWGTREIEAKPWRYAAVLKERP